MAYSTDTIFYCPLDSYPFIEQVNAVTGSGFLSTPSVEAFRFGNGYRMGHNYVEFASIPSPTSGLTIGFWLRPNNPGMVTNPNTGGTESLILPLISKCLFTTTLGTTSVSSVNFLIYEKTHELNMNSMVLQLSNGTTIETSQYAADQDHYFWFTFSSSALIAYVDLLKDTGATTTGSLPGSLSSSAQNLAINKSAPGSNYNLGRNAGLIDDIVIFNTVHASPTDQIRAANIGAKYVADTSLAVVEDISQAVVFDDASTVQINGMYSNRGNLYVGLSNGKLTRGVRSIWRCRHDFGNEQELAQVTVQRRGTTTEEVVNGALTITNEVIRI